MSQTKAQLIDNLVQPITGALGSASAPTFSFTSDPNTGLYSPGADQLALTTGGTGRLFIDSNGNIGLGTSSLINSAGYTTLFLNGSTGGSIGFKTGDVIKQYIYSTGTTLNYYGGGADSHIFYCSTEKMRLTATGLGIGTSSPADALHVVGKIAVTGTNPSIRQTVQTANLDLCGGTTVGTDSSIQIYGSTNATDANIIYYNGNTHIWRNAAGATERVRIDSSGRVGIGTTSPVSPFQVKVGTNQNIAINSDGSNARLSCFNDAASASAPLVINGSDIRFTTEGTERVRIDSSGRLLVGTSSSQAGAGANDLLQVVGPIQIVSSTNIYSRLVPSSTGLNIISNAYPANVGTTQNIKMSIGSSGGGGPNDVLLLRSTGQHMIGAAVSSTIGIAYPLEVISSSSAGVQGGLASYYGLISGMGYAVNHGSDNDNSCGVTFELNTQSIGGWRPGSFFVQVARCKGDATLATSAWYYYNFIMYAGSIGGSAVLQDSGGATGSFTISVTSTTGSWDGGANQSVILKVAVNSGSFSDAYTTMVVNLNTYNQIVRSERTSS